MILTNDPVVAKEALDKRIDPDLARATVLLQNNKGDEADDLLRGLVKRHGGNQYLIRQVGALLQQHRRGRALAELMKPLCDLLDVGGLTLPRDAQLYNLMGITLLDAAPQKAMTAFQNALRCDLKYGAAYVNLAQACEAAQRRPEARLALRRYLKLFPKGALADDARRRLRIAGNDNPP